ncbi:hypothetical protein FB451DRAFT_1233660 [Mycena latifolia]|nr:hypothetical protein FB451DRAFT_1233660 [Mycena latifolia]
MDDPWTHLASLAEHLAALLPPHPPARFLSFFHAPEARTPYEALCTALASISSSPSSSSAEAAGMEDGDEDIAALFPLLDALLPAYPALPPAVLMADAERALAAARGRPSDAFELVHVLRALDDGVLGGVYHSPVTSPLTSPVTSPFTSPITSPTTSAQARLPTGPGPTPPPPKLKPPLPAPPRNPGGWQPVPARRRRTVFAPNPLAAHIPAYKVDVNGFRVRPAIVSGSTGAGASTNGGGGDDHRRRARESLRRRDELLREAARAWQRGKGGRGGEVAFYFAERAREFQEVARREALGAARAMVQAKRTSDTVDLHGVTAAEAVVIVDEILEEGGWGAAKPLMIITGRGSHSANQTSVLKPALRRALEGSGWIVGAWDGGLSVKGRRGG